MTESTDALRAALEAAGLSLQAMPEEQRAMFTSLTEEEVTRLIRLRIGRSAGAADTPATDRAAELDGKDAPGESGAAAVPRRRGRDSSDV